MTMTTTDAQEDPAPRLAKSYSNRVSPYPDDAAFDRDYAVDRYMARGLMPEAPFVTKDTAIVAFGSCFASNISNYLHHRGYNVVTKGKNKSFVTRMGDGMTHTFAILQQFEWAWENKFPTEDLWHGYDAEKFGYDEEARQDTIKLFNEAEIFIITLGLSEIWYDEPTGEVFWRAPPKGVMDPARHKFRVATFEETKRNLGAIRALIAKYRPEANVVFTVSPIPLQASFRPIPCISANAASKAIVRAAVDEYYRETKPHDDKLHYFPSYDIVMYAFNHQWNADRRHVNGPVLHLNMQIFERYFCTPGIEADEVLDALRAAQDFDDEVGRKGHRPPKTAEHRQALLAKRQGRSGDRQPKTAEQKQALLAKRQARRKAATERDVQAAPAETSDVA